MKVLIWFCLVVAAFAARPGVEKSCTEKPESGPCMALFRMWYYDAETDTCFRFIYGGCAGNGNRYQTEEECLKTCQGKEVEEQPSRQQQHAVDCLALPEQGVCDAYMPRFYYDPLEARCKKFIYGGCRGNSNNFETEEECNHKCGDSVLEALPKIPFPFSCDCEGENSACSCCGHMKMSTIGLDQKACVEVGYNTDKKALTVAIKRNGKNVYSNTLSTKNPPPVCIPMGGLFLDVCFDFYDIQVKDKIHFCLNVKPRLIRKQVADFKVGCFNFNRKLEEGETTTTTTSYTTTVVSTTDTE